MNKNKNADSGLPQGSELREEAERRLRDKEFMPARSMSEVDARALLHELQVHQIELEMQNEELLRAQTALQEVSDKYHDLFDFAPVGYFLLDEHGRILEINLAGAAMLGLDRSRAVQRRLGEYVAVQSLGRFAQFCGEVLRADSKQTCQIELQRDNGRVCALLEGIRAPEGGKNRCFRVTATDITERERLEQADRQLASIVESSEDAIIAKTLSGFVLTWNAAAVRTYGYTAEEVVGRPISILIPPERTDELPRLLTRIARGERIANYETVRMRKDGTRIHVSLAVSPIVDAKGKILGVSTIARDITDWKQTEKVLADAKLSAEYANRTKDHFLAVLSHELRTPLTPVVLGISMLQRRQNLDPEVREMLEMVRCNVEMEVHLIDDLLDVTRIANGKIELSRSPIDLCSIIHGAVEVCKPDIEARGLHFEVELGPDAPYWVEADAPRLQQVFWNLLRNAVKFTPHGGCMGIGCRSDGMHVVVEVNDSGIGMDPESLPRVFTAFDQLEWSITRRFGGLGLGLTISKALVEMHGGTIEAHSKGKGKGATFRVRLPLTALAAQHDAPPSAAPPQQAVRPLHILLVDDHAVTANMVAMVLTSDGHTVEKAGNVARALELANQRTFDLLLSDLGLPDGSGYDLMRQLRERGHKLPGIALSGYGKDQDIQRSYEAGFAAHLTKPASRETIVAAIASVTATAMTTTETEPPAG